MNLFLRTQGFHHGAWRHPDAEPARSLDVDLAIGFVQEAERGLFDSVFLSEIMALGENPWQFLWGPFENLTILSAIAMRTTNIGLIGSKTTTYNQPYNLAREFASLDHISRGRAGWNIVTSQQPRTVANFSADDYMSHTNRYLRAAEFVEVVLQLWDSWDDDAMVGDKEAGILVDPSRVHPIDFEGAHFRVRGPLNVPRPVQGHPLLVQAGSSEEGMAFGARVADAIFTSQVAIEDGRTFYKNFKQLAQGYGRNPNDIKILPGLVPVLGSTVEEAEALATQLDELAVSDETLADLSNRFQVDLTKYPYDGPVPLEDIPRSAQIEGARSRYQLIVDLCQREHWTIRQLARWAVGSATHRMFVGTPEQLADDIETWVTTGAADGFNYMPGLNPNGISLFVDNVVPLLQKRGLYRREYESNTLRGHYGLPRVPAARSFTNERLTVD